jgi:flagellar hook-associated protein 3 FlgL
MNSAMRQLASGRRIEVPSDDPTAATSILKINADLAENEQYARNLSRARSLNTLQESVLDQVDEILVRGRELAIGQAGSNATAESRVIAAIEVRGLIEAVTDLANTRFGNRYIFAGLEVSSPPLPRPEGEPLPTGSTPIEISPGRTVTPNESASRIFGETGVLSALNRLAVALEGSDSEAIAGASVELRDAQASIQRLVVETGGVTNRIDAAGARIETLEASLKAYRSDLQDVNFESLISELAARETAFKAALLATSRILNQNLVDFLR